jgi:ribosomal protein L7Ae-like RNA K-turn-binding protein
MAYNSNDPFKEFGGKAIQSSNDPFAEFGGKAIDTKKKSTTAGAVGPTPIGGVSGTGLEPSPKLKVPKAKNVEIFPTKTRPREKGFFESATDYITGGPEAVLVQEDLDYIVDQAFNSAKGKYGTSFDKNFYNPKGGVNAQFSKSYMDSFLSNVGYRKNRESLNEVDRIAVDKRFNEYLKNQKAPSPSQGDQILRNLSGARINAQKNAALEQASTPEQKKKIQEVYSIYEKPPIPVVEEKKESKPVTKDSYPTTKAVLTDEFASMLDGSAIQDVNTYLLNNPGEYSKYVVVGAKGSIQAQTELVNKAMKPRFDRAVSELQVYADKGQMKALEELSGVTSQLNVYNAQLQILKKQIDAYAPTQMSPEQKKQFEIDKSNFQLKDTEFKDLNDKVTQLDALLKPVFDQLNQLKPYAEAGDQQAITRYKALYDKNEEQINTYNELIPNIKRIQDERNVAAQVVNKYATSTQDLNALNQYKESIDKYNKLYGEIQPLLNKQQELSDMLPNQDLDKIFELIGETQSIIDFSKKSQELAKEEPLIPSSPLAPNLGFKEFIYPFTEFIAESALKGAAGILSLTSDIREYVTGAPDDYYSWLDYNADIITKGFDLSGDTWTNNIVESYKLKDFRDPITGEMIWSPTSVVVGTAEGLGLIAMMATSTGFLRALGMTRNASVIAPMFFVTYNDNKDLAKQLGFQGSEVTSAATLFSLIEGTSELILPDDKLFQSGTKNQLFSRFLSNYAGRGKRAAIADLSETIAKEYGEEVLVEWSKAVTTLMTSAIGAENEQYTVTGTDLFETFVFTSLASGAPSVVQNIAMSSKNFNNAMKFQMASDLENSIQMIDTYNNLGKISNDKANTLKRDISVISAVQGQLPKDLSDAKRIVISNIYAERAAYDEKMNDSSISPEIKEGYKKVIKDLNNQIADVMLANDAEFSKVFNEDTNKETQVVMDAFNQEFAPQAPAVEVSDQDELRTQILTDIFGDSKVQRDADALEQRMNNAEEISVDEINTVLDGLYAQVESIMDNYFDNEAGKQYAQALLDKIDKLQNYEFATGTKTDVITERKAVQTARASVGKEASVINFARAPRATATITDESGAAGTYSIEVDGDGNVTFEQKGSEPIQVGNASNVNKSAKIVETQFDDKGLPSSVTFSVTGQDGKTYTINVVASNRLKPQQLLDLAIGIRANEVGTVDPTDFDTAFEEVTREVTTKTYPAKPQAATEGTTQAQKQDAVQVETAGQVPVQPEAGARQEVAQGEPQAEPQAPAQEGGPQEVESAANRNIREAIKQARRMQGVPEAVKSVINLFKKSGLRVVVIEDADEFARVAGIDNAEGLFRSDEGVIYLNPSKFTEGFGRLVVYHEGIHPIINIIRNTDKKLYNSVRDGLKKLSESNRDVAESFRWTEANSINKDPQSIEDEQIVETLARIADGKISLDSIPRTLLDRIVDLFNTISLSMGLGRPFRQGDLKSAASIARQITKALKSGKGLEGIVGKGNVGKYQWDSEVQKRVSDVFDGILDKIGINYGKETKKGIKKSTNYDVAKALSEYYKSQFKKIRVGDFSNKSIDLVSDYASDEIIFAMERFGKESGLGWYTEDFAKALDILSQLDESILSDQNVKEIATVAIAIASNSTDVLTNLTRIIYAIDYYNKNKSIPDNIGVGKGASAIASSIKRYNNLLENHFNGDVVALKEFMQTVRTVSESKQALIEKTGMKSWAQVLKSDLGTDPEWNENETLPTSVIIFGPKIGAFYSNLSGIGGTPTIDRWCIRTMYRYFGDMRSKVLPSEMNQFIEQQNLQGQSKGSVISLMEAHYKIFNDILQGKGEYANLSKDERNKLLSPYRKGHSIYSKLENIVNEIEDGLTEKITNKSQYAKDFRSFTKKSFEMVQQKVENKTGLKLQISDIQAILWIFEKNLFGYLGVKQKADSTYSAGANTIIDRVNSGKYTIDNLKKGNVKIDKNTILEDSSMGDVVAVNQKDYVLGVSDQPARLNSKVKTQPSPAAARSTRVASAPFFNTIITDVGQAEVLRKSKGYTDYLDMLNNVANEMGYDVEIYEQIGGYVNDSGEKVVEISTLVDLKGATIEDAVDYASLVGVLAPEIQESTIALKYVNKGSKDQTANEYFMTIDDVNGTLDALKAAGIDNFSLNETEKTISFIDVMDFRDLTLEEKIGTFVQELDKNNISHGKLKHRPINSVFVGDQVRSGNIKGLRAKWSGRKQGGKNLGDIIEQAVRRDGNRRGRISRGKYSALKGAPSVREINGPDPRLVDVAEQYARDNGIKLRRQAEYVTIDKAFSTEVGIAYGDMKHDPRNPKVKESYKDLIRQTIAQYQALVDAGYRFWFIDMNIPENAEYASTPYNALRDLRKNMEMGVFPTTDGFGSSDLDVNDNPLLAETGIMWPVGGLDGKLKPALANDIFRAVHDAFGHGLEGAGFRARGEENAWQAHVRLFYGPAVGAMTSETRGQNSWLNFGPYGDKNRTAKVEDTVFADQKTGLMPEWTWTERIAPSEDQFSPAVSRMIVEKPGMDTIKAANLTPAEVANWRKENKVSQREGRIPEVQQSAQDLADGKKTIYEHIETVKAIQPTRKTDRLKPMPSVKEVVSALADNQVKTGVLGLNVGIPEGTKVGSRLDIPSFNNYGINVVSVHDGTASGTSIGYGRAVSLSDVTFKTSPSQALNVATGASKGTFSRMMGTWNNESEESVFNRAKEAMNDPNWIQIGTNPFRHSWFYDKATGMPVMSASEILQVGNVVLAKDARVLDLTNAKDKAEFEDKFKVKLKSGKMSQFSPATPRGIMDVDMDTERAVKKAKGKTPKTWQDVDKAISDGDRVFGKYQMDDQLFEISNIDAALWFDLDDVLIVPGDDINADVTMPEGTKERLDKLERRAGMKGQPSPWAARVLMDVEKESQNYPYYEQLVNDAMVAYDMGVRNYVHFSKVIGRQPSVYMERAWEDAMNIKRGKKPLIQNQSDFKKYLTRLNRSELNTQERLKNLMRGRTVRLSERLFDSKEEFFKALAELGGDAASVISAYTTVIGGQSAKADYAANVFMAGTFDNLGEKQVYEINGQKYSELELYKEMLILFRVGEIQRKMEDKFKEFVSLDNQYKANPDPALKEKRDQIKDYLDRNKILIKTPQGWEMGKYKYTRGLDPIEASSKLAQIQNAHPEVYTKLVIRVDAYMEAFNTLLEKQVENGLISQESFDELKKYKYVPMQNVAYMLEDVVYGDELKIGKDNSEMIKRLKGGSEEDVNMNFDEILKFATFMTYRRIAQNNAAKKLYEAARDNVDNKAFYIPQANEFDKYGNETGWDYDSKKEGIIYAFFDGRRVAIATDRFIANAYNGTNKLFKDAPDWLGIAFLTTPFRAITTNLNPGFGLAQIIIDMPQAILATDAYSSVLRGTGGILFRDLKLIGGVIRGKLAKKLGINVNTEWDELYQEAIQYGALISFSKGANVKEGFQDKSYITRTIDRLTETKVGKGLSAYAGKVESVNTVMETVTRLAVYRKKRNTLINQYKKNNGGVKPTGQALDDIRTQAAATSLNMLNYNRGGSAVKPLNVVLAYLNVAFQVFYSNVENFKKNPWNYTFKATELVTYGTLATILAYMILDDDDKDEYIDKYNRMSEYEKYGYWHIPNRYRDPKNPDTYFIRLKKPGILLPLINSAEVYAMHHVTKGRTTKPMDYVKERMKDDMIAAQPFQGGLLSSIPSLNAFLIYNANYDYYRKQQVVKGEETKRDYLEGIDDPDVGKFYKYISKIGVIDPITDEGLLSPARMDKAVKAAIGNYENNLTTSLPMYLFDAALLAASGDYAALEKQLPEAEEKDLVTKIWEGTGLPKRFLANIPDVNPKYYDQKDELLKSKHALNQNLQKTVEQIINENPSTEKRIEMLRNHWKNTEKYLEVYSIDDYTRSLTNAIKYVENNKWFEDKPTWFKTFVMSPDQELKILIYKIETEGMDFDKIREIIRPLYMKGFIPDEVMEYISNDLESKKSKK